MSHPPEAVIDLGSLEHGAPDAASAPRRSIRELAGRWAGRPGGRGPGGWGPGGRWAGRPGGRWLLPGLLVALLLALVAGSARPAFTGVVTVPLSPGQGRFEVAGGRLFVAESAFDWVAHDLSTGERRWSVSTTGGFQMVSLENMLVHVNGAFAVDATTGELRWSKPGLKVVPGVAVGVLADEDRQHADGRFGIPVSHRLAGIDLATGEARWQESLADGVWAWLVGAPPQLVTASVAGVLAVRDPVTGELRASRQVLPPAAVFYPTQPMIQDSHLIVMSLTDRCGAGVTGVSEALPAPEPANCQVVNGYRLDTLTPVWERPLSGSSWVESCGAALCLHSTPRTELPHGVKSAGRVLQPLVEVVAPATGEVKWRAGSGSGRPVPVGGRLFMSDVGGQLREVVDVWTGETIRDLTGWRAFVPETPVGDQLALVRPGGSGSRSVDQPSVALLDLATLEITEQRWVPGAPERCLALDGGLACQYGRELWVWTW